MPKRKRSEQPDDGVDDELPQNPEDRKVARQAARLAQKFEHGAQALHKALKTARGFERQKLGRRQKNARANNDEAALARMEAEVRELKALDLAFTAEKYLFKQLVKTKRIAASPAFAKFRESKSVPLEGPKDAAQANVIARLMKSNPVKNVLPGIMGGIRELLGLDDAAPDAKKVKASKEVEEDGGKDEKKTKVTDTKRDEKRTQAHRDEQDGSSGEDEDQEGGGGEEEEKRSGDASDSDDESMNYSQFESRLAPSSGESDEESDDGSSEEEKDRPKGSKSNKKPAGAYDRAADLSLSPTPSASSSPEPSPPPASVKGSKKKAAASKKKTPAKSTTFLPTLMGGYWSGSESGAEDDAPEPPRRKNRMGQRARRALWEKKYGDKANHIQKEKQKQKQSRDSGWDPRRGATDADGDAQGKRGKGGAGAGAAKSQQAMNQNNKKAAEDRKKAQEQKKAQMEKPLHPSWEAARRAKEQQKASVPFQGKKIVFD